MLLTLCMICANLSIMEHDTHSHRNFNEIAKFLEAKSNLDGLAWLEALQVASGRSVLSLARMLGLSARSIHAARERGRLSEDTIRLVKMMMVMEHMLNYAECRAVFSLYANRDAEVKASKELAEASAGELREYVNSWGTYD